MAMDALSHPHTLEQSHLRGMNLPEYSTVTEEATGQRVAGGNLVQPTRHCEGLQPSH